MREVEAIENVELEAPHHQRKEHRLRQYLPRYRDMDIVVCHPHPLLRPMKFQLGANRVGGEEEDEDHQNTRDHGRTQIDIIVGPGVSNLMEVDGDRLEERANLFGSLTNRGELGRAYGSGTQRRNRLQITVKQGSGDKRHIAVIEGDLRLVTVKELISRSLGDKQERVNLIPLYGLARIVHIGIMAHDACSLKAIQLTDHGTAHVGVVLINNTYGHVYGLSSVHQGCEEKNH